MVLSQISVVEETGETGIFLTGLFSFDSRLATWVAKSDPQFEYNKQHFDFEVFYFLEPLTVSTSMTPALKKPRITTGLRTRTNWQL